MEKLCTNGEVALTMLELAGKDVRDLLAAQANAPPIALRENADGELELAGASVNTCESGSALLEALAKGHRRRRTCGTMINSTSSRSHMICLLHLTGGGSLVLVDCAGTERKEDSSRHTAERQREGAEINSSHLALKECVRALTSGAAHVPYRMNNLTRVLRDSFTKPGALLHAVATVAPGASDAEHSVATLRLACGLCDVGDQVHQKTEAVQRISRRALAPPALAPENRSVRAGLGSREGPRSAARAALEPHGSRPSSACPAPKRRSASSTGRAPSREAPGVQHARSGRFRSRAASPDVELHRQAQPRASMPATPRHPKQWTAAELQDWLRRQRVVATLPPATDGKTAVRWNLSRWNEACGGDARAGLRAFNGLRLEMDIVADQDKLRRKQLMGKA